MAICGIDESKWKPMHEIIEKEIRIQAEDLNPSLDDIPFQKVIYLFPPLFPSNSHEFI